MKVKLLEQRHCDVVKEMCEQHGTEKEVLTHHNSALEEKIVCLETEEARLRNDLLVAQKYSSSVEKENQALTGQVLLNCNPTKDRGIFVFSFQVSELQQLKEVLTEQVTILETEKQQYEFEREQVQVEPLLAQLSSLQIENSQLRDKNDEMVTEIESLNNKISAMRTRTSSPRQHEHSMDDVITCESITFGFKRRNDESPSKDLEALGIGILTLFIKNKKHVVAFLYRWY